MQKVPGRIRIFSEPGAPFLAMTATATPDEVDALIKDLNMRRKPVILRASPIQDHIKFVTVKRPSRACGMEGDIDKHGRSRPGLLHLLDILYLNRFI